ncbi:MAG TPA: hypothetical protein VK914_00465 [bacterium]|jgi:hypothetical protein|nr:hypothetical protein [bacterium]
MPKADTFVKEAGGLNGPSGALEPAASLLLLAGLGLLLASGMAQRAWLEGAFFRRPPEYGELAGLAGAVALVWLAWRSGLARWWLRPAFVLAGSLCAFGGLALAVMLTQHVGLVNGRWHVWLEDDAMVSMQYARHLAAGQGLVWTPGERVEGFSDPLWTLGMAGMLATGLPRALASAPVLLLNLLLGLASLPAVLRLARALGAPPLAAALAAAGFGLSYELVWAAASGMESVAMACLCAWALAGLAEAREEGGETPFWVLGCAAGLALLRFDGLLPAGLILALSWGLPSRRGRLFDALVLLAPLALWQAFRLAYYGAWVPNTVLMKSGDWPGRWQAGWFYLLRLDWESRLALLAALSALCLRPLRIWALCLLAALAYSLCTGGDFYPGTRYLAWAWPLLWALAAAALGAWTRPRVAAAGMALAALFSYQSLWAFPDLMQGGWADAQQRVQIAEGLDARVAPGERVASAWAGSFYFFSGVAGVDLLGKCDPVVARSAPDPSLGPSAHDKLDLARSLGDLKPAWVLLLPPQGPGTAGWLHTSYDRRIWEDPLFRAHCRGEVLAVGGPWALCRCDWTEAPKR